MYNFSYDFLKSENGKWTALIQNFNPSCRIDTYAMAGMALQCVKDYGSHMHNTAELGTALATIMQKLLDFRRPDGHIGNEFSTGLAVQARIFALNLLVVLIESAQTDLCSLNPPSCLLICSRRYWHWEAQ